MQKFLFLLLLAFQFSAQAQKEIDLTWSNEFDFRKNEEFNQILGTKDDKLYVLSSSGITPENSIDVTLDIYDASSLSYIKGISIVENKSEHNFEKVVITQGKLLIFTSYYDRQLGLKILAQQEYNEEANTLSEYQRLDEVSTNVKDEGRTFHITSSPDRNYILIYHDNQSPTGNKVFNLKVINYDFTSLWEKEISLSYKDKMVNFNDIKIDNASNVYLLSNINPFGFNKASGLGALVNVKNTLFMYRPYEDKIKEYEFALSKNWIDEVSMVFDNDQNLLATAFFTYPNDYKIRGFVLFKLNTASGEVMSRRIATLDKEQYKIIEESIDRLKEYSRMLVGNVSIYAGTNSHMSSTSTEFIMKGIFAYGDMTVLAIEAFRRDERCSESFSDQQMIVDCQKNYLYGDAMLFFLDKNCNVVNINQVIKMQHTVNKLNPYYSFSVTGNSKSMYVLYNDDFRNMEKPEEENETGKSGKAKNYEKIPLTNMNKSRLNIGAFSSIDGKSLSFSINGHEEDDIPFFPNGNISLSDSEFLLYSQTEKNYKFGKISVR